MPRSRGTNSIAISMPDQFDVRREYTERANLTSTYAMAIVLGVNPAGFAIPSQAPTNIRFRVEPTYSNAVSVEIVNDAMAAFASAGSAFIGVANPASQVWQTVGLYAKQARNAKAADILLDFVLACLDNHNFKNLDSLIGIMADDAAGEAVSRDPQFLARVINVLGLTLRYADHLSNRSALRAAYRDRVTEAEGTPAAEMAVEYL